MGGRAAPRRFVFATGNAGKRRELERILVGFELLSLSDFPGIVLPEEGDDYEANALAKAVAVFEATGLASLGDDSGVEVDALGGRPGVHSARYGGPGLDDRGRIARLLAELAPFPEPRTARFICVAACALPDGRRWTARGACEGTIVREARGDRGFGYDPVFVPSGERATWAELAQDRKDALSHRGRAFRALMRELDDGAGSDAGR